MALIFGVVADDLTGAMEIASMLVKHGVNCAFVTDPDLVGDCAQAQAIVVARRIRTAPPAFAVEEAERAAKRLLEAGARQIFFKYCATFDSTDEGNIGPVADQLAQMTGAKTTLFCPTFPEAGRTVYCGHLFVGFQLVSDSPKRLDPVTPMTDPRLVDVLQRQSKRSVGLLAHAHVRNGPAAIAQEMNRLQAAGTQHVIADAIDHGDLASIAAYAFDRPFLTGNSSLAEYLPGHWQQQGWFEPSPAVLEPQPVDGPCAVLAGSCAEKTLAQLDAFARKHPVLQIDLRKDMGLDQHVEEALSWAAARLDAGPLAIATSASPEAVRQIQARHGRQGASEMAEAILAAVAERLVAGGVRRLAVAGGETSGRVLEALGIHRLHVGSFREPGVSLACTMGPEPLGLCLKSGKLGPVDLLLDVFAMMAEPQGEAK